MGIYGQTYEPKIEDFETNFQIFFENLNNEIINLDSLISEDILTESLKDKVLLIWSKIVQIVKSIKTSFSNFLLNLNNLKVAKLPRQENQDLQRVLQVLQARTLTGSEDIIKFYNDIIRNSLDSFDIEDGKINRNFGNPEYSLRTNILYEMDKTIESIDKCLEAVYKMPEYSRLINNEYELKDVENIPIRTIVDECKTCRYNSTKLENQLLEIKFKTIPEQYSELTSKTIQFCKKEIDYYQIRIKLLFIYLHNAKFSLSKLNLADPPRTLLSVKPNGYKEFTLTIPVIEESNFEGMISLLQDLNARKIFSKYQIEFDKLCRYLKIPKNVVLVIQRIKTIDQNSSQIEGYYYEDNYEKIPVNNKKLYHCSYDDIKSGNLMPSCIGNGYRSYYPEPRIYLHINLPLSKIGKKFDTIIKNTKGEIEYPLARNSFMYEILDNIDSVYKDPEMGFSGAFIISDKPIKIKKVNIFSV